MTWNLYDRNNFNVLSTAIHVTIYKDQENNTKYEINYLDDQNESVIITIITQGIETARINTNPNGLIIQIGEEHLEINIADGEITATPNITVTADGATIMIFDPNMQSGSASFTTDESFTNSTGSERQMQRHGAEHNLLARLTEEELARISGNGSEHPGQE